MKLGVILTVICGLIAAAYINANQQLRAKSDLKALKLQMSISQVEEAFGSPHSRQRNVLTYILEDSSHLFITLRDDVVTNAMVKFHRPLRIEDPQMRRLTLVQMAPGNLGEEKPSWFFAGKPEEGLIYKITQKGEVESMTWVAPFTYGDNQAKNLQALLRDFKSQHLSNL